MKERDTFFPSELEHRNGLKLLAAMLPPWGLGIKPIYGEEQSQERKFET